MDFLNDRFSHVLLSPIPITLLGLVGIPVMIGSALTKSRSSGSGELGFLIPAILVGISALVGGALAIPAMFLGIPLFLGFPVAYYLSMVGIMAKLSSPR